jgi:hypothetical protein
LPFRPSLEVTLRRGKPGARPRLNPTAVAGARGRGPGGGVLLCALGLSPVEVLTGGPAGALEPFDADINAS